jgi:predicted acylesterase/phospholipase RssA
MELLNPTDPAEDCAETDPSLLNVDELLAKADYRTAEKPCDLIMKGGVTSGIVYPKAICKLARRFYFRNIGGTSAGAIAAALAAAAEVSRRRNAEGDNGFNLLAQLPDWLGSGTNLLDLFQPSPKTMPLFRVLLGAIGKKSLLTRSAHIAGNLVAAYPFEAFAAALAVALLSTPIVMRLGMTPLGWYAAITALVLAASMMLLTLAIRFFFALRSDIPNNAYGLCTGSVRTKAPQPLTVWLNERLSEYAGVSQVVTFNDLWTAVWPPGQQPINDRTVGIPLLDEDTQRANRSINLEMVTTNLTVGRPHTLPFSPLESDVYYYNPAEWNDFFPRTVLDALADGSKKCIASGEMVPQTYVYADGTRQTVEPLPAAADLPVIVAARMSLSFPILFSAVPLYAVGRDAAKSSGATVTKHWFSDGGLSSNLPLHFFDRPLTRWPTLALNLRGEVSQHTTDAARRVAMASDFAPDTNDLAEAGGARITKFLLSIFDTLQNWTDNTQLMMPGYRERVVEVQLAPNQGGLNLNMDVDVRQALSQRGAEAGVVLLQHYGGPATKVAPLWRHHRWVRLFSTISVAEMWLRHLELGYDSPVKPDQSYDELAASPPATCRYNWQTPSQGEWVRELAANLAGLGAKAKLQAPNDSAANGPPEPGPELRTRPRT